MGSEEGAIFRCVEADINQTHSRHLSLDGRCEFIRSEASLNPKAKLHVIISANP